MLMARSIHIVVFVCWWEGDRWAERTDTHTHNTDSPRSILYLEEGDRKGANGWRKGERKSKQVNREYTWDTLCVIVCLPSTATNLTDWQQRVRSLTMGGRYSVSRSRRRNSSCLNFLTRIAFTVFASVALNTCTHCITCRRTVLLILHICNIKRVNGLM